MRMSLPAIVSAARGRHEGQCPREGAPLPHRSPYPQPPPVQLDQAPRQREPEAGAVLTGALAGLLKRLEDPSLVLGGDPRPGIANRDPELAAASARARLHEAALRREPD